MVKQANLKDSLYFSTPISIISLKKTKIAKIIANPLNIFTILYKLRVSLDLGALNSLVLDSIELKQVSLAILYALIEQEPDII